MTEYLPASFIFRLAPPGFDPEVKVIREIRDNKDWDKPDFSSSYHCLQRFSLEDEWDTKPPHRHVAYNLLFEHVVISSESGLIRTHDGRMVADTFDHAQSTLDLFKYSDPHHVAIPQPQEQLVGCWLSLLSSNQDNYYHCLVMNIGKLFQIDAHEAKMIDGVLIPYHLTDVEYRALEIGLNYVFGERAIQIKRVQWGQSFAVEKIFFPWNAVAVFFGYTHSGVISFFRQLTLELNPLGVPLPTRFYIDRRAASNRMLHNEDELVEVLEQHGFAIIQLEHLTFDEQAHLFANADYIIGAHGAGLANMVFCKQGTKIIELMPHTLVRWCYRQIAMVADLPYQCIITQSHSENEGIPPAWASHHISIPDILDVLNH
ncbi:Capsular polysaccharide biosynthesis protein [Commensalibacter communis]|uniref:Capsular polysaccharide biosynthesis protein n=1 Tax=Commensalibacter communis TaxID=2972786 RepID=A0A9W4TNH5_9PROT|nr:glycosyltransferase family 61 protein [Commensalibacter communis]CAI3937096.1 Capsular polysaccharide biosynthesis protein [Commensalibacter communis]CAI3943226.1 Capsular polysaccharide biosynthesis protein [Commensalibacter communis]CAI3943436.1 Capsular polysaccharide biosynthesis protein [Commensalibacter communis]CAI3946360.1 Capsular polysaccharide biosynthesis protein [Commensalibacter communis]